MRKRELHVLILCVCFFALHVERVCYHMLHQIYILYCMYCFLRRPAKGLQLEISKLL